MKKSKVYTEREWAHHAIDLCENYALEMGEEKAYQIVSESPIVCRWAIEGFILANPVLQLYEAEPGDMSEPWTSFAGAYLTSCFIEKIASGNYEPEA